MRGSKGELMVDSYNLRRSTHLDSRFSEAESRNPALERLPILELVVNVPEEFQGLDQNT